MGKPLRPDSFFLFSACPELNNYIWPIALSSHNLDDSTITRLSEFVKSDVYHLILHLVENKNDPTIRSGELTILADQQTQYQT